MSMIGTIQATDGMAPGRGWDDSVYVTEPLVGPYDTGSPGWGDGTPRSGRTSSRAPDVYQGSFSDVLDAALATRTGTSDWTEIGSTYVVPAGYYDADITYSLGGANDAGWVNLVAENGEGSVELRTGSGRCRLTNGRFGMRWIGIDWVGSMRWEGDDLAGWYCLGQNPALPDWQGVNGFSSQPTVLSVSSSSNRTTMSGCTFRRSKGDLIKCDGKDVLWQGCLMHETKWDDWTYASFHSDAIQSVHATHVKILDCYFPEDARHQCGQESSYPSWWYIARTTWTGVNRTALTWDPKGRPEGPYVTYGPAVLTPDNPYGGAPWEAAEVADAWWKWGNDGDTLTKAGTTVLSGSVDNSTTPPAWFAEGSSIRANTHEGSPEKIWRDANPYDTWQAYFIDAASSFAGAEGGTP